MNFDQTFADYLNEDGVSAIQSLEQATGKRIIAYATPPEPADLSVEEKNKIRELEQKLCVRLVAYTAH